MIEFYQKHPDYVNVLKVCKTLGDAGFKAYLAGGCVRDSLLGRVPNDFDVASDARPDEVEQLFDKTISVGKAFGVIIVQMGESQIEVTRFRADRDYKDGRHPSSIEFSSEKEDALRRDFTINALFMDPFTHKIVDYVDGVKDIKSKQIRTVGDPQERFSEDGLRILRAFRFCSQLGFEIEKETLDACRKNRKNLNNVSVERVKEELRKLVFGENSINAFLLLVKNKVLEQLFLQLYIKSSPEAVFAVFSQWLKTCPKESGWILFMAALGLDGSNDYKNLKLSREEQREVDAFLYFYNLENLDHAKNIVHLKLLFNRGAFLGLTASSWKKKDQYIKIYKFYRGLEPQPLVRAQDLPMFQGKALGEVLDRAFNFQIMNMELKKENVLAHLKDEGLLR